MIKAINARRLLPLAVCAVLAACSSQEPVAYRDIASSSLMRANPGDDTGRVPYSYSTRVDWSTYGKTIVDPVGIYRGPDHQFSDMTEKDKTELARYMHTRFTRALMNRFQITNAAGPGTLRVKLTLTGAETNTPVLSTLLRFDIAGGLYNGVQAVRGREGLMNGSVIYVVEIYDAASNNLLDASVAKQYPGAYNIGATIGALAAAKTGIDKGAEALSEQLR